MTNVSGGKAPAQRRRRRLLHMLSACLLAAVASPPSPAAAPPLGHPDFYPSPERPLGWRGDGTGAWPGARPATTWNAETGENVVWRAEMPAPSFAQPLVVGERVFTMADPDRVVCVSVHDGHVLWQTAIDHTTAMPPPQRARARAEHAFIAGLRRDYGRWLLRRAAFEKELAARDLSLKKLEILDQGGKKDEAGLDLELGLGDKAAEAIVGPHGPIDAAIVAEYRSLTREEKKNNYSRPGAGSYSPGISVKEDNELSRRLIEANREYDLYLTDHWGEPWTTLTFATPCTDGSSIYVATANNAVARLGLDGTVKWLVWDHIAERDKGSSGWWKGTGIGTRFVPSPVYFQGRLIVNHNGELRVYDAASGKELWSVFDPHNCRGGQFPWRPKPEGPTPACTYFNLPDGSRLPVFTDGRAFYRLADGGMFKGLLRDQGACTPILVGDLCLWKFHPPPQAVARGAQRIKVLSRDELAVEDVWTIPRGAGGSGNSEVYFDGRLFFINDVFDVRSGKHITLDPDFGSHDKRNAVPIGHVSPIVAGDYEYCIGDGMGGGSKALVFPVAGGKATVLDAAYRDKRVFTDPEWQECYAWTENRMHASPCAQANRIFLRTKGYLWCFGDAGQPFPTPRDCPPEARVPRRP